MAFPGPRSARSLPGCLHDQLRRWCGSPPLIQADLHGCPCMAGLVCRAGRALSLEPLSQPPLIGWLSICGPYPLVACALNVAGLAMAMRDQMVLLAVAPAGRRGGAAGRGNDLGGVVSVAAYMPLPCARIPT